MEGCNDGTVSRSSERERIPLEVAVDQVEVSLTVDTSM